MNRIYNFFFLPDELTTHNVHTVNCIKYNCITKCLLTLLIAVILYGTVMTSIAYSAMKKSEAWQSKCNVNFEADKLIIELTDTI